MITKRGISAAPRARDGVSVLSSGIDFVGRIFPDENVKIIDIHVWSS